MSRNRLFPASGFCAALTLVEQGLDERRGARRPVACEIEAAEARPRSCEIDGGGERFRRERAVVDDNGKVERAQALAPCALLGLAVAGEGNDDRYSNGR